MLMASDKGPIATEAPPALPAPALQAPIINTISVDAVANDPVRTTSLKRARDTTPASPPATAGAFLDPIGSPPKAARLALSGGRRSPTPLTAAAALEDERRRREEEDEAQRLQPPGSSENPGHLALSALLSGAAAMSRPTDAPDAAPTAPMDATIKLPPPAAIPTDQTASVERIETSPRSPTSPTSLAGEHVTESPIPMDVDTRQEQETSPTGDQETRTQSGSLSYPGLVHAASALSAAMRVARERGMSYPDTDPNMSLNRRHKCPFCDTEFTRQHNLKSHLLTHSQEKPYVCQECQMRFRRLHDLKRHNKLHTGEKNHICPKCDRKFARGDALARHSKGAGGCAGRRSSMGSFAEGEDPDGSSIMDGDESMSGVVYGQDDDLPEEERRRQSLPNTKARPPSAEDAAGYLGDAHASTFPPPSLNRNRVDRSRAGQTGGLYPPKMDHLPVGSNSSSAMSKSQVGGQTTGSTGSSMPSKTLPYKTFDGNVRGKSGLEHPSGQALPIPASQSRPVGAQVVGGSGDSSSNMFASGDAGVWSYIQSLEDKVKLLTEKVATIEKSESAQQAQVVLLASELTTLRQQIESRDARA